MIRPDDGQNQGLLIFVQALGHDPAAAQRSLDAALGQQDPASEDGGGDPMLAMLATQIAYANEDWAGVVRLIGGLDRTEIPAVLMPTVRVTLYPDLVFALSKLGDARRAGLVAAGLSPTCYRCVIARGVAAEAAGDRAGADRWFAEAVRQGPSLPFAHEARGRAKLARGDLEGALSDFQEANRRGPNWADPLKGWGDVLMAQGDAKGAVRRYEAAAERAPRWAALQQALERARAAG